MRAKTRKLLSIVAITLALLGLPSLCSAQGCRQWTEILVRSFIPKQIDEDGLRKFSALSSQDYSQLARQIEEQNLIEIARSFPVESDLANSQEVETRLRPILARFYEIGSQLYGVHFSAENLAVVPARDVNAFATGSRVFLHDGLVHYFLNGPGYVAGLLGWQPGAYSMEEYNWLQSNFGWQNEWNGIYFVLAHEAAHNIMKHIDEHRLEPIRAMSQDYQRSVLDYRKDLAHGRHGGVKRYLWHSLENFTAQFESAEKQRESESQADAVGMLLLQKSGFDPAIAIAAAQRMDKLLGGGQVQGWQGAMTEVLCSTHPDWIQRIQRMDMNLNCLRLAGKLCEEHVTYPVESSLGQLRKTMGESDKYNQETLRIAEGKVEPSDGMGRVQVETEPRDAELKIDGTATAPGKLQLPIGPHTLSAEKPGYESTDLSVVVFPDTEAKVKVKVKKARR